MVKRFAPFLLILILKAPTAASTELSVESLYDVNSRIPHAMIPFRVTGPAESGPLVVNSATVTDSGGLDCRLMKDPYIPSIVLLKCTGVATVHFRVLATTGAGDVVSFNVGPVLVKNPENAVPIGGTPVSNVGQQLFSANCGGCHSDPNAKRGRTAAQIRSAISTRPEMNTPALHGLSDDQLESIASYLSKL